MTSSRSTTSIRTRLRERRTSRSGRGSRAVRSRRCVSSSTRVRLPPCSSNTDSGVPPKQIRPRSLADYLDVLSRIAFEAGLSGRVVEAKWDHIRRAFHAFEPERVARMTPRAVDKLLADDRVIRSRSKIEATIANAETLLDLAEEHRGFKRYLRSHADFESTAKDLRKRF